MKLGSFLVLSALSLGGFIFLSWQSSKLPYPIPEEAVQGKLVWQRYNCISCHSIFGNGGYSGDDMTNITRKRSSQEITDFFIDPPIMRPNHKRPHLSVSQLEAEQLIQYFEYLQEIPTLGWPPNPRKSGDTI